MLIYFVALVPNNAEAKPDWSKCDQDEDYKPLYCYGNDGKLLSKNERKIIKKEKLVTIYKSWSIPEKANPNYKTLVHYLIKYKNDELKFGRYGAKGSKNPYQFKSDLREDKYIKNKCRKLHY